MAPSDQCLPGGRCISPLLPSMDTHDRHGRQRDHQRSSKKSTSHFVLPSIALCLLVLVLCATAAEAQRPRTPSRPANAKRRAEGPTGANSSSPAPSNNNNNNNNKQGTSNKAPASTTLPTPELIPTNQGGVTLGAGIGAGSTVTFSLSSSTMASMNVNNKGSQQQLPQQSQQTPAIGDVKKMDAVKSVTVPPPTLLPSNSLSKRVGSESSDESDEIINDDEDSGEGNGAVGKPDNGKKPDDQDSDESDWSKLYTTLPADAEGRNKPWGDRTAYTRRLNMTRVDHIEAECQDDFMKIFLRFNGTFDGLIYSSGYSYDPDCIYINGSGKSDYEFFIQLNRCGTLGGNNHDTVDRSRNQPSKSFMWNTVTIQYNMMIEEEWDEHFKVTCEYGYDFWKTVTFPMLDVQVATGNPVVFTLTPPECHMEIRYGYGITGNRITGPVRVGDPLTLVIYMRSQYEGFDMVVNNCFAHNGAQKKIPLIDRFGCPVDEKLISSFQGTWTNDGVYETQVYAYMKAFRFTGSPALYLECEVRMCHGYCPSQPCHWRSAGRRKRDLPALPDASSNTFSKNKVTDVKSSYYPGFFRKSRFTNNGEEIEVDSMAQEAAISNANVTTISLFQALQVLKDVTEEQSVPSDEGDLGTSAGESSSAGADKSRTDVQKGSFIPDPESFCIKTGVFTALLGICCLMILLMATGCCFLFIRMRRTLSSTEKVIEPHHHDFVAPKRRVR